MIDSKLIALLRCPIDGSQLELADESLLRRVNDAIERGELRDRADQKVSAALDGALVAGQGKRVYPIRRHIPTLIADEAIELAPLQKN